MKLVLRLLGFGLIAVTLTAVAFCLWAWWASDRALSRHMDTRVVDFPAHAFSRP